VLFGLVWAGFGLALSLVGLALGWAGLALGWAELASLIGFCLVSFFGGIGLCFLRTGFCVGVFLLLCDLNWLLGWVVIAWGWIGLALAWFGLGFGSFQ
jgi:hypothetical protein